MVSGKKWSCQTCGPSDCSSAGPRVGRHAATVRPPRCRHPRRAGREHTRRSVPPNRYCLVRRVRERRVARPVVQRRVSARFIIRRRSLPYGAAQICCTLPPVASAWALRTRSSRSESALSRPDSKVPPHHCTSTGWRGATDRQRSPRRPLARTQPGRVRPARPASRRGDPPRPADPAPSAPTHPIGPSRSRSDTAAATGTRADRDFGYADPPVRATHGRSARTSRPRSHPTSGALRAWHGLAPIGGRSEIRRWPGRGQVPSALG